MEQLSPDCLKVVERPEIFIGLVAPVGTPLPLVERLLREDLEERDYTVDTIHLSSLLEGLRGESSLPGDKPTEFQRISALMDRGNELRRQRGGGYALALLAAAEISAERPQDGPQAMDGRAFILRQLKHPEEALWLRLIYGSSFHLVGVYSPEEERLNHLRELGMTGSEANALLERDKSEGQALGQRLRDTFHQADVFIPVGTSPEDTEREIRRYLRLVFRDLSQGVETPTREEYGMFLAASAALRSADLSRQVGAAVLRHSGEVLGLGTNEVPAGGGGQYWAAEEKDGRDHSMGHDANAKQKEEIVDEVSRSLVEALGESGSSHRAAIEKVLRESSVMDLTEFGRAVHAEMEALLSAARSGSSVRDCELFTTTFPCHNCAKHLVGAGIRRVIYIEPYPKSKALDLHADAILLAETEQKTKDVGIECHRMRLEPFVGVAPRRYWSLFSMVNEAGERYARKDREGNVLREIHGQRSEYSALNYMEREAAALAALNEFALSSDKEDR